MHVPWSSNTWSSMEHEHLCWLWLAAGSLGCPRGPGAELRQHTGQWRVFRPQARRGGRAITGGRGRAAGKNAQPAVRPRIFNLLTSPASLPG
jgi:hypothetical protein